MGSLISAYLQDMSMGKLEVNKNWKVFSFRFYSFRFCSLLRFTLVCYIFPYSITRNKIYIFCTIYHRKTLTLLKHIISKTIVAIFADKSLLATEKQNKVQ